MKTLVSILIVAAVLQARTAVAQIIIIGQERHATASVFVSSAGDFDSDVQSETAPDTGPFDVALTADAAITDGTAHADASQDSEIATHFIRSQGEISATADVYVQSATAYGSSESNVAVRFMLSQPTPYTILGFIEGSGDGNMTVQLSHPFETVEWFSATDQHIDLNAQGMLVGDTYDLNVTLSATAAAPDPVSGSGRYDVLLVLGQSTDAPVVAASPALRAFPNPFRESTRLALPEGANGARILDARGRLVRILTSSSPTVLFDGRDASGQPLTSGVYWVQPLGGKSHDTVKLVRIR